MKIIQIKGSEGELICCHASDIAALAKSKDGDIFFFYTPMNKVMELDKDQDFDKLKELIFGDSINTVKHKDNHGGN